MTTSIHGFCDVRFAPLREAFVQNFEGGLDVGASLAVTHRGAFVADLWAGHYDQARTHQWEKDTVVTVASTTKVMAIISMLILIDRGKIELDAPVARYWPEFAQGGKAHVTVRDAMTHQAGVPGLDPPASGEMACDWDLITARIAAEPHWFNGERRLGYHALTYGYILGEVIRRVDARGPGTFFREEIASRCGANFWIDLPPITEFQPMALPIMPPNALSAECFGGKLLNAIDNSNARTIERARVENPGSHGVGGARGIARVMAIIANRGELDGVRYFSPEIVAEAGREQAYAQCPYCGCPRMGLGFGLDSKEFQAPSPDATHWGGYDGSWAMADPSSCVSVGFAPNNWSVPPPDLEQMDASREPRLGRFMAALRPILKTLADEH